MLTDRWASLRHYLVQFWAATAPVFSWIVARSYFFLLSKSRWNYSFFTTWVARSAMISIPSWFFFLLLLSYLLVFPLFFHLFSYLTYLFCLYMPQKKIEQIIWKKLSTKLCPQVLKNMLNTENIHIRFS